MRLIDADELLKHKYHDSNRYENAVPCHYIYNAPTIELPTWIPCSERLPEEGQVVLVIMGDGHKLDWEEQRFVELGRISSDRYDCSGTGWEWLNESVADFWEPDWNNLVIAWMPIPAYEETDHE